MTDLRTAAQQALEALEWHYRQGHSNTLGGLRLKIDEKTLRNLKAALAEPVQEPFCYVYEYDSPYGLHREFYPREYNGMKPSRTVPVYTAPPQRQAEPVQEPVAWRFQSAVGGWAYGSQPPVGSKYPVFPLYAAPPQRKPLTEEEIDAEWHELDGEAGLMFRRVLRNFARAIERKVRGE